MHWTVIIDGHTVDFEQSGPEGSELASFVHATCQCGGAYAMAATEQRAIAIIERKHREHKPA